jgi:hypothetical protein
MLLMSFRARVLLCLIALLLLIPVAGIRLQDETRLMHFHQRRLSPLPSPVQLVRDPVGYFRLGRAWLNERAFPIVQASSLHAHFQLYVLRTPPQRHILLGSDGFVFINSDSDATVNSFLESICVNAHADAVAAQLRDGMPSIAAFARSRNLAVDLVVVPTAITLYANHLPASVPQRYRDACLERYLGHSPLARLTAPAGVSFVFPFQPMQAASGDEAFYPKGNWHPIGMSLKVVRDTYLSAIGVGKAVDERLELGAAPSEILYPFGIRMNLPVYSVRNSHVQFDTERDAAVNAAIRERFQGSHAATRAYRNTNPVIDESVLMLSDSYGEFASEVFAGAFRHVIQVTSNNLPPQNLIDVVDRVRQTARIDRLILLVEEGNVGSLLVWSDASRTAPPAPSATSAAP